MGRTFSLRFLPHTSIYMFIGVFLIRPWWQCCQYLPKKLQTIILYHIDEPKWLWKILKQSSNQVILDNVWNRNKTTSHYENPNTIYSIQLAFFSKYTTFSLNSLPLFRKIPFLNAGPKDPQPGHKARFLAPSWVENLYQPQSANAASLSFRFNSWSNMVLGCLEYFDDQNVSTTISCCFASCNLTRVSPRAKTLQCKPSCCQGKGLKINRKI